jgi:hypothetical protein
VDAKHPLVKLGGKIAWSKFEELLGLTYHATHGAPGVNTRLMAALHYLKYQHDLSDEAAVAIKGKRLPRRAFVRWRSRAVFQINSSEQHSTGPPAPDPPAALRLRPGPAS